MVRDTIFSLLPTVCPIPSETPVGGLIFWSTPVIADRQHQRAYIPGVDKDNRLYLLCADLSPLFSAEGVLHPTSEKLPLTIYYTDPLPDCGFNAPILTDDGDIAFVGGNSQRGFLFDNYKPCASSYMLRLGNGGNLEAVASTSRLWVWLILLVLVAAVLVVVLRKRGKPSADVTPALAGNQITS